MNCCARVPHPTKSWLPDRRHMRLAQSLQIHRQVDYVETEDPSHPIARRGKYEQQQGRHELCTNLTVVRISAQYLRPQQSGELAARQINVRIMCVSIMVSMNGSEWSSVRPERAIHVRRSCIFALFRLNSLPRSRFSRF